MARKAPVIEVKELCNDAENTNLHIIDQSARAMIAFDIAELIKSFIEQGKLQIKDGQVVPVLQHE